MSTQENLKKPNKKPAEKNLIFTPHQPLMVEFQRPWFYNGGIVIGVLFCLAIMEFTMSLKTILFPFLMGTIGAYALNGPTKLLTLKLKLPRSISSAILILLVLCVIALFTIIAFPFIQRQLVGLARRLPTLSEDIEQIVIPLLETMFHDTEIINVQSIKVGLKDQVTQHLTHSMQWIITLLTSGMVIANFVTLLVLTPIVMFYLLNDWPNLLQAIHQLLPKKHAPLIEQKANEIHQNLGAYFKGQIKVCLSLMVLYSIALYAIGLKNAILVGVTTGLFSFIPYLGTLIGILASMGIAFSQFQTIGPFIAILVVFITVNLFETNFLAPKLIGSKIGLPPLGIIFAILAGGTWFGFLGILCALPATAILSVILRQVIYWYKTTQWYKG